MRNLAVIDQDFDSNVSSTYHLSVCIGNRSLSYAILDSVRNRYLAVRQLWSEEAWEPERMPALLKTLFNTDKHLSLPYRRIRVCYQSPSAVLVPGHLFNPADPAIHLEHSFSAGPREACVYSSVEALDAVAVFAMTADLDSLIRFLLPDARLLHPYGPLLASLNPASEPLKADRTMLACVYPGHADLLLRNQGLLMYCSTVRVTDINDLAYNILYLFEQFGLPQEETPLLIAGYSEYYPGLQELLAGYVRQLSLAPLPGGFTYGKALRDLPGHEFHLLLNLALCE